MAKAFALSGTNLLSFDTASPATLTATRAITGVDGSETLVGIDFRPQNGILYALGVNATGNTATLYAISERTGFATAVGTPGQITFTTDGVTAVDLPDPATTGYGFDFNPAADRIRVVTDSGLNFRINPNTGAAIDGDNGGVVIAGTNPDGAINTGTTSVDGAGYTNNEPNNGNVTTLYTLDPSTDRLFIQNPPNNGGQVLVGPTGVDFTTVNGFDIPAGVNAAANNILVAAGSAFAVLNVGAATGLYSINLATGAATLVGNVGNGTTAVQGFALQNDLGGIPAIALDVGGTNLIRFSTATPGTTTTVPIVAGLVGGEQLVAIDYRPATGQLYGLGVNATNDTATLYLVTPQTVTAGVDTATLTVAVAGTGSAITFAGIDLPDPALNGYGFDFNPDVDRIRVTTSTGLNFRVNPATGLPAAATADGLISGNGATGVSAAAYTNSFGNDVAITATTLYTLDAASDRLFIQNPPDNGNQSSPLPVTLGGAPLDFSDVNGFDIPSNVRVGTSNSPANGFGYANLTAGGFGGLYRIDLSTGAATLLGPIGAGAGTPLAGLALANVPNTPPVIQTGAAQSVAEGATVVAALTAFDLDFDPVTFTITGGANAGLFAVSGGNLVLQAARNFETQAGNLQVQVTASDSYDTASKLITVSLTNVAPTTPTDGNAAANAAIEGAPAGTAVGLTVASSEPGGPLAYALTNSANGAFAINAASGVVTIADPAKIDYGASASHTYVITAIATDGTTAVAQNFAIAVTEALNPAFRFFDPSTGDHFYTTSEAERAFVASSLPNFRFEGAQWATPQKGVATVDVFRFYDRTAGDHFYTTSAVERDTILQTRPDLSFEGVGFQAYANAGREGTFQLERFFNRITGDHHFAASAGEAAGINAGAAGPGWVDEGAVFTVHAPTGAFLV